MDSKWEDDEFLNRMKKRRMGKGLLRRDNTGHHQAGENKLARRTAVCAMM
jgi:hypothetical protein